MLVVLLAAEFAVVAAAAGYLLVELVVAQPSSYASAVAVLVLTLIAAAWIGSIVVGTLRGRAWIRGAAIVWQVLQFAVGIGSLQGPSPTPPSASGSSFPPWSSSSSCSCRRWWRPRRAATTCRPAPTETGAVQAQSSPSFFRSDATWPVAFTL
nr:hypothetical protein GCM10025699_46950 [Microbacterium flavescens]